MVKIEKTREFFPVEREHEGGEGNDLENSKGGESCGRSEIEHDEI
jgi:hypothetical protein